MLTQRLEFLLACAAVFLAPMNFARFPGIYFTFSDAIVVACLAITLMRLPMPARPFGLATPLYLFGFLLMLGGLLASSLFVGNPTRGVIVFVQYVAAYLVVPVFVINRPAEQLVTLIKVFVASICVMSLHGIYLIHIDGEINTTFVSGNGRLRGFVERSNEAAALMGLTWPLALWLWRAGHMRTLPTIAISALIFYGILLTGSNTGTLTALCAAAVFLSTTLRLGRLFLAFALIGTVAVGAVTVGRDYLPRVFQDRVLVALDKGSIDEAGTFADRLLISEEAYRLTDHTWVLGLGADQYRVVSRFSAPVHNMYLLIWTEGGFIALVGWILMLLALMITSLAGASTPMGRINMMCAMSVLLPFALLINGTPHVYGRFWVFPLFLALALVLRMGSLAQSASRREEVGYVGQRSLA